MIWWSSNQQIVRCPFISCLMYFLLASWLGIKEKLSLSLVEVVFDMLSICYFLCYQFWVPASEFNSHNYEIWNIICALWTFSILCIWRKIVLQSCTSNAINFQFMHMLQLSTWVSIALRLLHPISVGKKMKQIYTISFIVFPLQHMLSRFN